MLRHGVEQQLRDVGDLSYVQFQLLARLGLDSPTGSRRMTDLADGVVYSRSGLTCQAGLLERAGLVERFPSPDDERSVMVTITAADRERLAHVLPGHVEVLREMFLKPLSRRRRRPRRAAHASARSHAREPTALGKAAPPQRPASDT